MDIRDTLLQFARLRLRFITNQYVSQFANRFVKKLDIATHVVVPGC